MSRRPFSQRTRAGRVVVTASVCVTTAGDKPNCVLRMPAVHINIALNPASSAQPAVRQSYTPGITNNPGFFIRLRSMVDFLISSFPF